MSDYIHTVQDLVDRGVLAPPIDGNHGEIHPKAADFVPTGVPFIMASDLKGGRVDLHGCSKIKADQAKTLRKGFAQTGDVLLSHKGTVGRTAIVGALEGDYLVLTPQVTYYRVLDKNVLDARYLRCYFDSHDFQSRLEAWANSGSTRAYLGITAQRQLPVVVPPIHEQRAIASVLSALDDKIEANRALNETLEATCQALFRSWFIDFDPVVAKSEGRRPAHMSDEVAALFPDSFEDSSIGPIPKGWRVGEVGDEVQVVGGSTPSTSKKEFWEEGHHHWITPKDLSLRPIPLVQESTRKITDAGLAKISSGLLAPGTVLMSSRAPIGYVAVADVPVAINQGFIAMVCDNTLPSHYISQWCLLSMEEIKSRAGGTTFAEISKKNFRPIPVIVPSSTCLNAYTSIAVPIYSQISALLMEVRSLEETRDALLPRLLSGEVRVKQAEKLVEEAV